MPGVSPAIAPSTAVSDEPTASIGDSVGSPSTDANARSVPSSATIGVVSDQAGALWNSQKSYKCIAARRLVAVAARPMGLRPSMSSIVRSNP